MLLLTDGFIANGAQPWKIPAMADYPEIHPPIAAEAPEGGFLPYKRDAGRLARQWAFPGEKGLEHRIGGLEKDYLKGTASHDPINHQRMVDVRAEKVERIVDYIPEQQVVGGKSGDLLVVGWGGTCGHLLTAVNQLQAEGKAVGLCHFNYINPLPKGVREIFAGYKKIVVCELNKGQFADYLRINLQPFEYLQYNKVQGLPFAVSELVDEFEKLLSEL